MLHQDNRHAEFVAKFDEFYRSSLASSSLKGARYFFATYIKALKELHQTERMGDAAKFAFQSLKVDYYTAREIITAIQAEPSLNSVRRELGELWISRIIPKLSDIGSDDYWAAYEISVQAGSERSLIEYLESELKKLNSAQSNLKSAALEILSYAHGRVGDRDLQLKDLDALLSDLPAGGDKETQLRRQRFQILKLLVVSQKKDLREANELAGILLQEFEKAFEARHQEFIYKNSAEYHALKHQQMLEMLHRESQRPERSFEEMEAAFEAKDSVRKLEMARERFVRKEGFPKISLEGNWLLMLAAYPKLQQFSHPLWITLSKKVTEGKFLEAMNLSWDYQERANYKSESLDSPRALENLKYAYQQGPKALGLLGFSLRDFFL
jgi:hypothetical protein